VALGAALALAAAVVLQSRGVRALGDARLGPVGLVRRLVRQPVWLGGMALAGGSGLLHAAALRRGTLVEVEAIMVTSLLFALAFGSWLTRQRVPRRDWVSAALVVGGLVAFLAFADPHGDDYSVPGVRWVVLAVVVAGAVGGLIALALRTAHANVRAAAWGTAAAVLLGTSAVLLKVVAVRLEDGPGAVLSSPSLYAMLACELVAIFCQQFAFRSGDFAAAIAPFVGANPLVAGAIGIALFDERFHRTPTDLVGAVIGLALIAVGITSLATSPLVAAGSGEAAPAG